MSIADTLLPEDAKATIETALADHRMVGGRFDVQFDSPSVWGTIISRMMNWRSRMSGIATGDLIACRIAVRPLLFSSVHSFGRNAVGHQTLGGHCHWPGSSPSTREVAQYVSLPSSNTWPFTPCSFHTRVMTNVEPRVRRSV